MDEAHYGSGDNQELDKVLSKHDKTFRLGITATPYRSTDSVSVLKLFGKLVPDPPLIRDQLVNYEDRRYRTVQVLAKIAKSSRLIGVPFEVKWDDKRLNMSSDKPLKKFDNPKAREGIAAAWNKTYGQTLVFALDTEHANGLAKAFRKHHGRDLKLQVLHSKTLPKNLDFVVESERRVPLNRYLRERVRIKFLDETITVLISVDMFIAGMDFPKVKTVFMSRPTFSSVRYNQIIGRGLRGPQFGGTEELRVIDFCDQGDAHDKSTAYLMTMDKALSYKDHSNEVAFVNWVEGHPPRILSIGHIESLPSERGIWAAYSKKGKTRYGNWRWTMGDIYTEVDKKRRENRWSKTVVIVYYQLDKAGTPATISVALKNNSIQKVIKEKFKDAIDKHVSY